MRTSKFTGEQMVHALKQAELGISVEEVCRKMGISTATFYKWRQKYAGVGPSELRRVRQLEEEGRKLKQIVANLSLDKAMLQHIVQKSLGPSRRRELVAELMSLFGCSQRNAMRVAQVTQGSFFYKPVKKDEAALRMPVNEITSTRVHHGYRRVHVLLRREGHPDTRRVLRQCVAHHPSALLHHPAGLPCPPNTRPDIISPRELCETFTNTTRLICNLPVCDGLASHTGRRRRLFSQSTQRFERWQIRLNVAHAR